MFYPFFQKAIDRNARHHILPNVKESLFKVIEPSVGRRVESARDGRRLCRDVSQHRRRERRLQLLRRRWRRKTAGGFASWRPIPRGRRQARVRRGILWPETQCRTARLRCGFGRFYHFFSLFLRWLFFQVAESESSLIVTVCHITLSILLNLWVHRINMFWLVALRILICSRQFHHLAFEWEAREMQHFAVAVVVVLVVVVVAVVVAVNEWELASIHFRV